jgi:hypothetical protein
MAKRTLRKNKRRKNSRRKLPYRTYKTQVGGGATISVISWNVLARNATYHNCKNDRLTEWIELNINGKPTKVLDSIISQARSYEHFGATLKRYEQIVPVIKDYDVVLLQEIDQYLYEYLKANLGTHDGYYRIPPISKNTKVPCDLYGEFGTAILWKKQTFDQTDEKCFSIPLDYLSYGLFINLTEKKRVNEKDFNIHDINYPSFLAMNTETTLTTNNYNGYTNTYYEFKPESRITNYATDKLIFGYDTEDGRSEVKVSQLHLDQRKTINDDMFGKKPATYVRLHHIPTKKCCDFVSVHLHGQKQKDGANKKAPKMMKFITDVIKITKSTDVVLTVIGGDFNAILDDKNEIKVQLNGSKYTPRSQYKRVIQKNNAEEPTTLDFDYAPDENNKKAQIDYLFYEANFYDQKVEEIAENEVAKQATATEVAKQATATASDLIVLKSVKVNGKPTPIHIASTKDCNTISTDNPPVSDHYPITSTFTI